MESKCILHFQCKQKERKKFSIMKICRAGHRPGGAAHRARYARCGRTALRSSRILHTRAETCRGRWAGRRLRSPGAGYSGLPETPGSFRCSSGGVSSSSPHLGRRAGKTRGRRLRPGRPETPARNFLQQTKLCPFLHFLVHDAKGKNMSINLHHLASY